MRIFVRPMAESYQKEHKSKRSWLKVVTFLACIVVFCTTYALILPAITWEQSLICEKPEHTHSEDCYVDATICICGLEEDEEHTHTDECCQTEKVLFCEIEEHTHTASCFDAPPAEDDGYRCGKVEHIHTEDCYYEDGTLRCTITEHTHTDECRREPEDSETEANWVKAFENDLKGEPIKDTHAVALSQIGCKESKDNFIVSTDFEVSGLTRYGLWFGKPYEKWDALFAAFCLNYAEAEWAPFSPSADRWMEFLEKEKLVTYPADATPESGYVTFYAERDEETGEIARIHAAVFSYKTEKKDGEQTEIIFTLIEGDVKNSKTDVDEVAYVEISPNDVLGYLIPKSVEDEEVIVPTDSEEITEPTDSEEVIEPTDSKEITVPDDGEEITDDSPDQTEPDISEEPDDNIGSDTTEDDQPSSFSEDPVYDNTDPVLTPVEDPEDPVLDPEDETDEDKLEESLFTVALAAEFNGPFFAPLAAAPLPNGGGYWKRVSSIDDTSAHYMIVSKNSGMALGVSSTGAKTSTSVTFTPVDGLASYYTTPFDNELYQWTFGATGNSSSQRNVGNTGRYLDPADSAIITTSSQTNTLAHDGDSWRFSRETGWLIWTTTYYLGNSFEQLEDSSPGYNMYVYKYVPGYTVTLDPGEGSGAQIKYGVPENESLGYDTTFAEPSFTSPVAGYFIVGWKSSADGKTYTTDEVKTMPTTENVTYTAVWGDSVNVNVWKKITSTDELDSTSNYLIVTQSNGHAFGAVSNDSGNTAHVDPAFQNFDGYDNYYTSDIGEEYQWQLVSGTASTTIKNAKYNRYLRLDNNTILSTNNNATTNTLAYDTTNNRWRISNGTRYLQYNSGFGRSSSNTTTYANMNIYKQLPAYTVIFNTDGGTGGGSIIVPEGEAIGDNVPDTTMAQSTLTGWKSASGTIYTPTEIKALTVNENMVFTAQWKHNGYAIVLDPGFESDIYSSESFILQKDQTLNGLGSAFRHTDWQRDGYVITGWKRSTDGEIVDMAAIKSTPATYNVTYTAQWEPAKVVSFNVGEFEENILPIDPISVLPYSPIDEDLLPIPLWGSSSPLPFDGWYLDPDFNTRYTDQPITADTTLYAKFAPADNAYYVYFYDYDRPGITADVVLRTMAIQEGEKVRIYTLDNVPAPEGQQWSGKWYVDREKTVEYDFDTIVSESEYLGGPIDHDLYLWPGQTHIYRVIFITNGDRLVPLPVSDGTNVNISNYIPTKEGSEFAGWYLDKELTEPAPSTITVDEDTFLYAKWAPNYVPFTAVIHLENNDSTRFTSAGSLGTWYALAGSRIFTKTSGTTHTVWCRTEDGDEYPVYSTEPTYNAATGEYSGTQATLADEFNDYYVYNDADTDDWQNFIAQGRPEIVPYSSLTVLPDGHGIINFDYMRVRTDLTFYLGKSNSATRTIGSGWGATTYTLGPGGIDLAMLEDVSTNFVHNGTEYSGTINGIDWTYSTADSTYNKFVVKNVKYNQTIADVWPLATWITDNSANFAFWLSTDSVGADGSTQLQASRIRDMSSEFYLASSPTGRSAKGANYYSVFQGSNQYALMYAFECYPYETPDFTVNGVGYKVDTSYSQVLTSSSQTSWGAKGIPGATATSDSFSRVTNLSNSIGGTTYNALFNKYKSAYGQTGTIGNSTWNGVFVLTYRRDPADLAFDFQWDYDGSGENTTESYDLLYGQDISSYKYATPDGTMHPALTRDEYTFVGWMDEFGETYTDAQWADMKADVLSSGSDTTAKTFYAKWEPNQGNVIEFYETEYSETPDSRHVFIDGSFVQPPSSIVPDEGWVWKNSDIGYMTAYTGDIPLYGEYGVREATDLFDGEERWVIKVYGRWSYTNLRVRYDANTAKGGIQKNVPTDSQNYLIGTSQIPIMDMDDKSNTNGMKFVGWKLDKNGVTYQPGDHVVAQWMPLITFTAQWVDEEKVVYLRYDANSGRELTDGSTVYPHPPSAGFEYAENASAFVWDNTTATDDIETDYFVKNKYRFVGWNTMPDGSGTSYKAGDSVMLNTASLTSDDDGNDKLLTLYAQWELATVDLTITKVLEGATTGGPFNFIAEVVTEGGEFTAPDANNDDYTLDDDGAAHFTLRPNESATLHVTVDADVRITEVNGNGYYVKFTDGSYVANGSTQTIKVSENRTVTVHNVVKAPLPSTGTRATPTSLYAIGILILVSEALLYVYIQRRSRERGNTH